MAPLGGNCSSAHSELAQGSTGSVSQALGEMAMGPWDSRVSMLPRRPHGQLCASVGHQDLLSRNLFQALLLSKVTPIEHSVTGSSRDGGRR